MQARYYDPVIGRFYSNDPVGFTNVHTFNRYAYANNNPYRYTDPDGRTATSQFMKLYNSPFGQKAIRTTGKIVDATSISVTKSKGLNFRGKTPSGLGVKLELGVKATSTITSDESKQGITVSAEGTAAVNTGSEATSGSAQLFKVEVKVDPSAGRISDATVEGANLNGAGASKKGAGLTADGKASLTIGNVKVEIDTTKINF